MARTRWTAEGQSVDIAENDLPQGGRLNPLGNWSPLLGDFRGRVLYERPFHQPTGLHRQAVWLIVEGVDAFADVQLNGDSLGRLAGDEIMRIDISAKLQLRNRLALMIELPLLDEQSAPLPRPQGNAAQAGGLIGGVRLEIDES